MGERPRVKAVDVGAEMSAPVVSEMITLKVEYDSLLDVMAGKVRSARRWEM
jgi:hypothetical protein